MKKVNWPLAYIITGAIDALQLIGDIIPGVDFIVIPANEFIDVAIGAGIAWWAKRIKALDLSSGLAIGVTFLIEEASGALAPFWIGDIAILHMKYKAKQLAAASSAMESGVQSAQKMASEGRLEPTGRPAPLYENGRGRVREQ